MESVHQGGHINHIKKVAHQGGPYRRRTSTGILVHWNGRGPLKPAHHSHVPLMRVPEDATVQRLRLPSVHRARQLCFIKRTAGAVE